MSNINAKSINVGRLNVTENVMYHQGRPFDFTSAGGGGGGAIGINDLTDAYSDSDFNLLLGENGSSLSTGSKNTSVGQDALKSQTTGSENVALGFEPLRDNTAGEWNIAVGAGALLSNANGGSRNIAIGSKALSDLNTTDAASNTSNGSNNVVIGDKAGNDEATGGVSIVTGGKNVLLGYRCSANKLDATNQIIIGAEALGIGDNSVVLGNSSITKTELKGNVGIGTSSPSAKLEVYGDITTTGDVEIGINNSSNKGIRMNLLDASGTVFIQNSPTLGNCDATGYCGKIKLTGSLSQGGQGGFTWTNSVLESDSVVLLQYHTNFNTASSDKAKVIITYVTNGNSKQIYLYNSSTSTITFSSGLIHDYIHYFIVNPTT
tara:strand:+ start:16 stop:1146 length:1131 start_codon:yes stop_codon:yes gene_type:complete